MSTYLLTVATPDGNLLHEQVSALFVRGALGDLAILAGHIPFVTTVKPGVCRVEFEDGSEKLGHTDGGILTVSDNETTLLSGTFEWDKQ